MRRASVLVPAVAAVSMLVGGCGGGSTNAVSPATNANSKNDSTQLPSLLANTPDVAAEAGTVRTAAIVVLEGADGTTLQMPIESTFDAMHRRGRTVMDMSQIAELSGSPGKPALWRSEVVIDDGVGYMRMPAFQRMAPGSKPWLRFDTNGGKKQDPAMLSEMSRSDPRIMLQPLRAADEDVENMGRTQIDGIEVTHYRTLIDLNKAIASAPPVLRAEVRRNLRDVMKGGITEALTDVWIDDEGLVRRLMERYGDKPVPFGDTGLSGKLSTQVDFFDYGKPVTIRVPPASQVMEFDALLDQIRQG
jgi:hypothetical protein